MKKVILLLAVMLTSLATATAAENTSATLDKGLDLTSRYRYAHPIMFVERGVEFLIFADGSFDFNTDFNGNTPRSNAYYRSRRQTTNVTFGAPGTQYRHRGGRRGVLIQHDNLGRVRRIGNVFMNYDRQGRIKRVGSVYMRYNNRRLTQVGGLRLQYNRRGRLVNTNGYVNFANQDCNINIGHNNDWDYGNNNDDDFYYYRNNGKVKKQKKLKRLTR